MIKDLITSILMSVNNMKGIMRADTVNT